MNISLQNVDKVSALLTLKLEKADYQARVEKTLKTYRQKANIPGFRPGMVPMSLINCYDSLVMDIPSCSYTTVLYPYFRIL